MNKPAYKEQNDLLGYYSTLGSLGCDWVWSLRALFIKFLNFVLYFADAGKIIWDKAFMSVITLQHVQPTGDSLVTCRSCLIKRNCIILFVTFLHRMFLFLQCVSSAPTRSNRLRPIRSLGKLHLNSFWIKLHTHKYQSPNVPDLKYLEQNLWKCVKNREITKV